MSEALDTTTLFQMDAQMVTSLRTPFESLEVTVLVFSDRSSQPTEEFSVSDIFPFQTVQDLQYRIFELSGQKQEYHPSFQFLGIPPVNPAVEPMEQVDTYLPSTHQWKIGKAQLYLTNPWKRAEHPRPDEKFVTASGESKAVEFTSRREFLLETLVDEIQAMRISKEMSTEEPIVFHLFLYSAISAAIPGVKPTSDATWKGKVIPYYPYITRELEQGDINLAEANLYTERLLARLEAINHLNDLLESAPVSPLTFAGLRHMRLQWSKSTDASQAIESIFYETDVTKTLPYLRFFSAGAPTPVSKVHVEGVVPRPSLEEPQILSQWAQEKSPLEDRDFMIGKLFLRHGLGQSTPPLYGTLRLFEGGSADFILQPPRQTRKLDPRTDLDQLTDILSTTLPPFYLNLEAAQLTDISFYLSLRLARDAPKITRKLLLRKLGAFRAFFQETTSLPGETPLLTLRYKSVNQFTTEDRVFSFCTQITQRCLLKGTPTSPAKLAEFVQKEFQLTAPEAQRRVTAWYERAGEVVVTNTETLEFGAQYNPGTDIAIYAQHPFYSFHVYRADSLRTYRRVITLLTLLIGLNEEDLNLKADAIDSLECEEREAKAAAAVAARVAPPPVPARPGVPAAPLVANAVDEEEEEEEEGVVPELSADMLALLQEDFADEGEPAVEAAVAPVRPAAPPPPPGRPAAPAVAVAADEENSNAGDEGGAGAENDDDEETTDPVKLKDEPAATYFIKRLKYYDKQLFDYSKKHPSAKKYVRQCASNLIRQPSVMNYEEFTSMTETYAEDKVVFIVYGPGRTEFPEVPAGYEEVTVLEYGSNLLQPSYYICSKYWCRKDEIVVLEKDFISERDRNVPARSKPKNTCPFCRGTLVDQTQRDSTIKGQTVLERIPHPRQKGRDKRFLSIGFLKKTNPDGLYLPCCFLPKKIRKPILKTHPAFLPFEESQRRQLTVQGAPPDLVEEELEAEGEVPGEENVGEGVAPPAVSSVPEFALRVTDYFGKLQRLHRSYIVGSEKLPLEVTEEPQVGLLPPILDRYFEQNPESIVERAFTTMGLKESSRGFLRLGVENRQRYAADSFLSALAPYLLKNNAAQVKARILEVVTPEVFFNLNYGNFLLEFYDPSVPIVEGEENPSQEAIDKVLKTWASTAIHISFTSANRQAIQRAFQAYANFRAKLFDISTVKEYRQFAELLATPELLTARGLLFVVLEINKKGELHVRCPAYGVRPDIGQRVDIGFLFHHQPSGIWEPILYTENRPSTKSFPESHEVSLIFQRDLEPAWPPILRHRIGQFLYTCRGPGRAIYTSESRVNPAALLPISRAIKQSKIPPTGVIRDAYNHIAALTFEVRPGSKSMVILPVADDGTMVGRTLSLHLDWDDVKPARADDVVRYYTENFKQILSFYPGYAFMVTLYSKETQRPVAIQMKNGLKIPISPPQSAEFALPGPAKEKVYMTYPEWYLNKQIIYDTALALASADNGNTGTGAAAALAAPMRERDAGAPPEGAAALQKEVSARELEEIYQHLRVTFANWIVSEAAGKQTRTDIKQICKRNDLPLYERRKRLDILLYSIVTSWMDSTVPSPMRTTAAILRVDCRTRSKDQCTNRCVWRDDDTPHCALHVPATTTINEDEGVDVPTLLLHRLIEELLRFTNLRNQLLENEVTRIITLHSAVRLKDQYIIPENIPAWTELLRMEWLHPPTEQPRFWEELSAPTESNAPLAPAPRAALPPLPPALIATLGGDPAGFPVPLTLFTPAALRDLPPLAPFKDFLELTDIDIPADSSVFSDKTIARIASKKKSAVIQLDYSAAPSAAAGSPAPEVLARFVVQSGNPKPDVLVLVNSPGLPPSLLVTDPSQPAALPFDSIPDTLKVILRNARAIFVKA